MNHIAIEVVFLILLLEQINLLVKSHLVMNDIRLLDFGVSIISSTWLCSFEMVTQGSIELS